jgi:hypothetical protein
MFRICEQYADGTAAFRLKRRNRSGSPRPSVPQYFNGPVLHLRNAARVEDHGASVSTASRRAVMLPLLSSVSEVRASFRKDHFGV